MIQKIPTLLTLLRIVLTPFFIYYFLQETQNARILATIIYFFASFTDWLDGYIARKINHTTRLGQFLDPIADKILVSSALFIFAYKDYLYLWMVIIIVVRDILITALRMYALHRGKVIITSSFAKTKTFIQMGFVLLMIFYLTFPMLPDITLSYSWTDWIMWPTIIGAIVTVLTAASGIHYIMYNRSHINEIFKRLTKKWHT
ncbi:MAG: CDP-diacylglycerol--glycerol-3-phosphate 3-phosphatidyltransferase [Calditrichaeota bacterium]|nr:MAG: CDP-diacylglycerol--glycerol-3-phosphate 3-phosphatidyltransferase [Calditrichota bacterium]MBL1206837.1 CDP-diacylglycerol--glycerol-3-phosphate 3-phosphatidyltransferase [Calditrichota bacterium]NOG46664.1 CDP-diacylglycerol--glycerol-3-phosphate 3-phosphatidyltransferase [Calditrichota bacterium]